MVEICGIIVWIKWCNRIAVAKAGAAHRMDLRLRSKSSQCLHCKCFAAQSSIRVPGNITCNVHVNIRPNMK